MAKNLDYYIALPYRMVLVPDMEEGGYTISFPELPGCITSVDNVEEITKIAEDAKKSWLEAAIEDGLPIPEPIHEREEDYSGQFKLRIPKSLHMMLSIEAKKEGISMNQYCVYLLSLNSGMRQANS